jgi:hypothetical protein
VIQHIIDAPMVIADLTDSNANVFYELAVRHMVRKPYVQIIHKSQQQPFDVSSLRSLPYNHLDLDEAVQAKEDLEAAIRAVKNEYEIHNPITAAIDLKSLTKSDNPEQRQIAELVQGMSTLQNTVNSLAQYLSPSTASQRWFDALQGSFASGMLNPHHTMAAAGLSRSEYATIPGEHLGFASPTGKKKDSPDGGSKA